MEYQLRPVTLEDVNDLHQFCWKKRPPVIIRGFLERCISMSEKKRAATVVVDYNNHAVGFGLLTKWAKLAEISDLIVTPSLRSKGIGAKLVEHLTEEARKLHVQKLEIGAAESNPRAKALYERLGFTPHRTLLLKLDNGEEPVHYLVKHL